MARASKADVDKAFTAGYEDKDIELDPNAELEDNTPAALVEAAESNTDLENNPIVNLVDNANDVTPAAKVEADAAVDDEWAGVPESMKKRFTDLEANLTKVQNIANSASGRANKLQSQVDKKANDSPVEKPVLTSVQLLEAMTNKGSRDSLREDFGEFAAALDEIDQSVSTSVGSAMDQLRAEMREEAKAMNAASMAELESKRSLDNKHPGWENTVQDAKFKKWAYQGGPSEQESQYYDSLVFQAHQAAPEESAALYDSANNYFSTMTENHPVWAAEKGKLFGDSSGEAAISLLDLYEKAKGPEPKPAPTAAEIAAQQETNVFEDNLTPTSGQSRQVPSATTDAVNKAFEEGYNS